MLFTLDRKGGRIGLQLLCCLLVLLGRDVPGTVAQGQEGARNTTQLLHLFVFTERSAC